MYIDGVAKWEKSTEDDKSRRTVTVYEAENGFVVYTCIYTKPQPKANGEVDYNGSKEKTKLYISKTNPLAGLDKADDKFKINIDSPAKEGEIIIED